MARLDFLNALGRESKGIPAVGTGTSIVCLDLMHEAKSFFPQAHCDPEKMAGLAQCGHNVLGFDVVMPLFSVCHETAALGCEVDWGQVDQMPFCKGFIYQNAEDIAVKPDFIKHHACEVPLKAITLLKRRLGDCAAVCGKAFGPWTLAYHLFGIENFLIDTVENPAKVKSIIEKLLPVTLAFANAQIDAGADCILLGDHATADLCSPSAYGTFLQQVHAFLAQEMKVPLILHICGNTSDRIKMIARTGINCFHWDTKSGSAEHVRALAGESMALMGGISNTLLLTGTPEDVFKQASAAAQAGIDIIGPECAIPLKTPLANIKAVAEVRKAKP